jgi:hypothetical protein
MATEIKELAKLPVEDQSMILEALCKNYNPIEIDDKVYLIPEEVGELIDNLVMQLNDLRTAQNKTNIGKERN